MFRALAWKEWREQRLVVLAAMALALCLPVVLAGGKWLLQGRIEVHAVAFDTLMVFSVLLWPLTALLTGAGAAANNRRTLDFLLTRPVSRVRVWLVKIALGATALLCVTLLSSMFARLLIALTGGGTASMSTALLPVGLLEGRSRDGLLLSALVLLFSTAVFFGTWIRQPLLAAGAGLALSFGLLALTVLMQARLAMVLNLDTNWLLAELLLFSLLLMMASLARFARVEMSRAAGARNRRLLVGGAAAVVVLMAWLPVSRAFPRLTPATARIMGAVPGPAGGLALQVTSEDMRASEVWSLVHGSGNSPTRLGAAPSFTPAFTPDGEWIVFLTRRFFSSEVSLRMSRRGGEDERVIDDALPGPGWPVADSVHVSPDGRLVALTRGWQLVVADLQGKARRIDHDLDGMPEERATVIGWTPDSRSVLLLINPVRSKWRTRDEARARLAAFDVASRLLRTVATLAALAYTPAAWRPARGITQVPLAEAPRFERREDGHLQRPLQFSVSLIDVHSGERTAVAEGACWWNALSVDLEERHLVYALCPADGDRQIRVREISSGEDRLVTTTDDGIGSLELSRAGDRIALWSCAGAGTPGQECNSLILDLAGRAVALDKGWRPLGWHGDGNQLWLAQPAHRASRLALADAGSGEIREVFP